MKKPVYQPEKMGDPAFSKKYGQAWKRYDKKMQKAQIASNRQTTTTLNLKPGDKVKTEHGIGIIIRSDAELGVLSNRYLVKLDSTIKLNTTLSLTHAVFEGLYYDIKELSLLKS